MRYPHKVSDSQINHHHSMRTPGKKGSNISMKKQQVLKGTSFQLLYTSGLFHDFTQIKPEGEKRNSQLHSHKSII
jgi:hypothetical protein